MSVTSIIDIYVTLIQEGVKTIEDVPEGIRAEVQTTLAQNTIN